MLELFLDWTTKKQDKTKLEGVKFIFELEWLLAENQPFCTHRLGCLFCVSIVFRSLVCLFPYLHISPRHHFAQRGSLPSTLPLKNIINWHRANTLSLKVQLIKAGHSWLAFSCFRSLRHTTCYCSKELKRSSLRPFPTYSKQVSELTEVLDQEYYNNRIPCVWIAGGWNFDGWTSDTQTKKILGAHLGMTCTLEAIAQYQMVNYYAIILECAFCYRTIILSIILYESVSIGLYIFLFFFPCGFTSVTSFQTFKTILYKNRIARHLLG